jgi:ABC-type sulfate transport system permease component
VRNLNAWLDKKPDIFGWSNHTVFHAMVSVLALIVVPLLVLSATGVMNSANAATTTHTTLDARTTTSTTNSFTVSGNQTLDNGVPWTPQGFTLSTFQVPSETFPQCECEYSTITAQMNAVKDAWNGNTVRIHYVEGRY